MGPRGTQAGSTTFPATAPTHTGFLLLKGFLSKQILSFSELILLPSLRQSWGLEGISPQKRSRGRIPMPLLHSTYQPVPLNSLQVTTPLQLSGNREIGTYIPIWLPGHPARAGQGGQGTKTLPAPQYWTRGFDCLPWLGTRYSAKADRP